MSKGSMVEDRFLRLEAPDGPGAKQVWYYKAREGRIGPFETREAASAHLSTRFRTYESEGASASGLKRLLSVFHRSPQPAERRRNPRPTDAAAQQEWETADPKLTDAFGRPARLLHPMASDQYRRLPENHTIAVTLSPDDKLEIYLASYRFELKRSGNSLHLIDDNGKEHIIVAGTSTIGRRSNNDVVTDTNLTDISRCHLMVEWSGGDDVRLTDLSTLGTFVPPEYITD